MSVRVMSWVWEHSRSAGADRLVLLAIADAANDLGRDAYPSLTTIARKANMDKRTAQRSVRNLIELGELKVAESAGPRGTHRYQIVIPKGWQHATRGGTTPPATGHPPRQDTSGETPPGVATDHGWRDTGGDTPRGVASDPLGGGETPPEPSLTHPSVAKKGGQRPETLPASNGAHPATEKPPGRAVASDEPSDEPRCPRHPLADSSEPCAGCARVREWRDRNEERHRLAELERLRNCPECEGMGFLLDADKKPTGAKCQHRASRRAS